MKYTVFAQYPGESEPESVSSYGSAKEARAVVDEYQREDDADGIKVRYFWAQEPGEIETEADFLRRAWGMRKGA